MKISIRQNEILHFILSEPYSPISKISRVLNFSEKTVRKDIENINIYLQEYDSQIRQNIKRELYMYTPYTLNWWRRKSAESVSYPITDMVKLKILFSFSPITVQQLSDDFYYTKPMMEKVIYSDLFDSLNIERRRNVGMYFAGTKRERFEVIVTIFEKFSTYANFLRVIQSLLQQLPMSLISGEDIEQCVQIISKYVSESQVQYTDKAIRNLFIALVVLIVMSREKVEANPIVITTAEVESFLEIYNQFFNEKIDSSFLQEIFNSLRQYEIHLLNEFHTEQIKILCDYIQVRVNEKLQIDSSKMDQVVKRQLEEHIFQTMRRISRENYSVTQNVNDKYTEIINEFRTTYPLAYEAGRIALSILEEELEKKGNIIEIVYLGIYFQLFLATQPKALTLKVLIICEHGFGIINFLKDTIQRKLPNISNIDTISVFQFMNNNVDYEAYDFFITTVDDLYVEKLYEKKVIHISSIITDADIAIVREKSNSVIFATMIQSAHQKLVIANAEFSTKEEIIEVINLYLLENQIVNSMFKQSVFDRERIAPTDFTDIAIPHGDSSFVIKDSYVLITLKTPVLWNTHYVSIVAMFIPTSESLLQFRESVSIFYEQFASKKHIQTLLKATNKEQVIQVLLEGVI